MRKNSCGRATLTLFLWAFFLLVPSLPAFPKTLEGKVLKVFNGDTVLVRIQGKEEHVRLREVDAPEIAHRGQMGQEPWGRRAREVARSLVHGKEVRLEIEDKDERDKYRRLLAYVFTDRAFVNEEMVRAGYAFFYPVSSGGKYARGLEKAEREAREKGLGVWDPKKGLKERPSDFRHRTHREEGLFSGLKRLIGTREPQKAFKEFPVPEGKIVGNRRSKLYHPAGSPQATRVAPKNREYFDSPGDAEKAGFRPAHKAVIGDQ